MSQDNRKFYVAEATQYPAIAPKGYYASAFKKTALERAEVKQVQREHKRAIDKEYRDYSATQRKRIINPSNV